MHKGFFITGTDTGVGKTFVATGLIRALKGKGFNVCPMKPAETGCRVRKGQLVAADTLQLIRTSCIKEPVDLINPYRFKAPLSPAIAAGLEGIHINSRTIVNAYKKLAKKYEFIIVEGAGGLMVPLDKSYLFLDLIRDLGLPLLIIAKPGLGTINHSLLTIQAARQKGIEVSGVIINNAEQSLKDLSYKTNPEVIARTGNVTILGIIPHIAQSGTAVRDKVFDMISAQLTD